jgi:hypothetical protein
MFCCAITMWPSSPRESQKRIMPSHIPQAIQWASLLFEPTDILEVRCFPSKDLSEEQLSWKYLWDRTRKHHEFFPWFQASKIEAALPILEQFNEGVATWWGCRQRIDRNWSEMKTLDGIPLNIYCSANPRKRIGGRKADDVALARSLFADLDESSLEEATKRREQAKMPRPSMTVLSGHGVHFYWRLLEPTSDLACWTAMQKHIIKALESDEKIHDPARFMRLPGFMNVNGKPAPCLLGDCDASLRYSVEELVAKLPAEKMEPAWSLDLDLQSKPRLMDLRGSILERAFAYLDKCRRPERGQRNNRIFDLCGNVTEKFGLSEEQVIDVFELFNQMCDEPLDDAELKEVVLKAHRHIQKKMGLNEFVDVPEEPDPVELPVISIDEWRSQMAKSRLESLKQPSAFYFDGSPTGAGKSTADLAAMKLHGDSVTIVPTHDGVAEVVQNLQEEGLSTAAFPPINAETCQRFGTDKRPGVAQNAGLNVGEALCPECKFAKNCTYQILREKARTARHSVCTHARASSSAFDAIGDRSLVFIHENCIDLLRPTVRVAGSRKNPGEPCLADLVAVRQVAQHASLLVSTWRDEKKITFFAALLQATEELANHLQPEQEETGDAPPDQPRAVRLPLRDPLPRPQRCDSVLFRAMEDIGVKPHGNALQLCLGHACGELHALALVTDDFYAKGGKKRLQRALIGVWKVDPPAGARIWFEDATGNLEIISRLVEKPIQDLTPHGRLEYAVPPVQFSDDVTRRTSGNIVRGSLRGLLTLQRNAKKVGIIAHKCHVPEIERLESFWRNRLLRLDYFGSGNDRGSNAWLECDLLIILGTPRVPPSAVRQRLIQIGTLDAAALDGQWGVKSWLGRNALGERVVVRGSGYTNPDWQEAHETLVADALRQALGRGRGLLTEGITVIVVSNERLGITLSDNPLPLVKDPEAQSLQAVADLSTESANSNILAKTVVSTSDLALRRNISETQARMHLVSLTSLGLLKRKGERGGWSLPTESDDLGAIQAIPHPLSPLVADQPSAWIMDDYNLCEF